MPPLFPSPTQRPGDIGYLPWIFPHGKGVIKEELFFTPSAAGKRAVDTLKPVVVNMREQNDLGPHAYNIAAAEGIETLCCIL